MYKVIRNFADMQDNMTIYNIGDNYPREGYEPTEERIAELSGNDNAFGAPIIEIIKVKNKKGV